MPDDEYKNGNIFNEEESLRELKEMLAENDRFKKLKSDDSYLERFLKVTDYNSKAAFEKMSIFYEVLLEYPNWFPKFSPADKKDLIDRQMRVILQNKDKEGRPIYIVKLGAMDPGVMDLLDVVAVDDFYVETLFLLNAGLENGLCVLVDISNFSLRLTKWLSPSNVKIALKRILSMPIKDFKYHVINNSLMVNVGIKLMWPLLPQDIKDSVKFHWCDFESLHQYIDKEELPEEYGGSLKFDYIQQNSLILDRTEEIFENFKMNRLMYLETVDSHNKTSDD